MLKDSSSVLKKLSLYLQKNESNVLSAIDHIDSAKEQMLACGYDDNGHFHDVEVIQNDNDVQKFDVFRGQFLQALYDNLCQQFPCTDVLSAARTLCPQSWPDDVLQRALFGQNDIAFLCKTFKL